MEKFEFKDPNNPTPEEKAEWREANKGKLDAAAKTVEGLEGLADGTVMDTSDKTPEELAEERKAANERAAE